MACEGAVVSWTNPPPTFEPPLVKVEQSEATKTITLRNPFTATSAPDTDYWQRTHYGFQHDNGHFLHTQLNTAYYHTKMQLHVSWTPKHLYDQAGLMIRVSADSWIKVCVEAGGGEEPTRLGCVVTRDGFSDWSTQDFPATQNEIMFQIEREGSSFVISWAKHPATPTEPPKWFQLRVAHLPISPTIPAFCGLFLCAPNLAPGFAAQFHSFSISEY
ncbi:uncharacterized protein Pelo_8684 [Pelomyxa schiedti]|nr:uncharacterized protein Pelo_8684 [Pelomyxa schiedti]